MLGKLYKRNINYLLEKQKVKVKAEKIEFSN